MRAILRETDGNSMVASLYSHLRGDATPRGGGWLLPYTSRSLLSEADA
jgi:hypothetical protein